MTAPRSCEPLRKNSVPSASEYSGALGHCTFLRQLHRAFVFWLLPIETEVTSIEIFDPAHVVAHEGRAIERFCEFNQLFFVVNIGQSRSDAIIRKQPLQRRLTKRSLRIFQKTQLIDLFDPIEQPGAGSMTAVVGWWKGRLGRV